MQNKIALSIIMVNYKSEQCIEKCIVSVREKIKNLSFEIIIVNNDKNPSSRLLTSDAVGYGGQVTLPLEKEENIKTINSEENIGFGRANNLGAKEARGEYLLFLNPDTILLTENIKKVIGEFEGNEKIGIIGLRLVDESGNAEKWSAGDEANAINLIRNNLGLAKSRKIWESKEKTETDRVSGSAMFIKKELFDNIGGFDENFFMYFEDEDLCKRVKQAGYKILYFPEAEVRHLGGESFENKKEQKKLFYASQDYYFQKHFGKVTGWAVKFLRKITLAK